MPGKLCFLRGIESTADNSVPVIKSHLAGGDAADLRCHGVVNFVADCKKSKELVVSRRPKIDWLQKNLVQVVSAEPPLACAFLIERNAEGLLRHFPRKAGRCGVQSNDFACPVRQHKQVTTRQTPQVSRAILNGGLVLCGHQSAQSRKVGEQFRQVDQRNLAFPLEVLEGADGVMQVGNNTLLDLCLYTATHQQQAAPG